MKRLILAGFCLFFFASSIAQTSTFDKRLADSLGADEHGMRMYTLVMLKSGSDTTLSKSVRDSLFRGHMQNMDRLVTEGKLVVAGPLGKNEKGYRGIFILTVKPEDAGDLLQTDPAIHAGALVPEIYRWYGSAALPLHIPYHDRMVKK